jgi:hypothetical protein
MTKMTLWFVLAVGAVAGFAACQEEKSTGDHLEDAIDSVGKAGKSAADDVKEAVDEATDQE